MHFCGAVDWCQGLHMLGKCSATELYFQLLILQCSTGCPGACDSPVSCVQLLRLQACVNVPGNGNSVHTFSFMTSWNVLNFLHPFGCIVESTRPTCKDQIYMSHLYWVNPMGAVLLSFYLKKNLSQNFTGTRWGEIQSRELLSVIMVVQVLNFCLRYPLL